MTENKTRLQQAIELFADLSTTLIESGANTDRALRNLERIAGHLNYNCHTIHSYSGVLMTVEDKQTKEKETRIVSIKGHGIDFNKVSDISILSWETIDNDYGIAEVRQELDKIKAKPHYNKYVVWFFVSLAGASLCRIFGGDFFQFMAAFIATLAGLFGRSIFLKYGYNIYVCWLAGAFISVSTVNLFRLADAPMQEALTTCVLWMIPGVPLINGLIDVLNGHIVSGFAKYINAMLMIFMIAVGFFLSLIIFGYGLNH